MIFMSWFIDLSASLAQFDLSLTRSLQTQVKSALLYISAPAQSDLKPESSGGDMTVTINNAKFSKRRSHRRESEVVSQRKA